MSTEPKNQEWSLAFVMPDLRLKEAFDLGAAVAIVPHDDSRLDSIKKNNAASKALIEGFDRSEVAALIYSDEINFKNKWSALIDARNLIAVGCCCTGWVRTVGNSNGFACRDSDYFDFYPRWPSDDGENLIYRGPSLELVTDVSNGFEGEGHPYIRTNSFTVVVYSEELLDSLFQVWWRVHAKNRPSRMDRRILRSLSLAFEACRVPQTMDDPLYDHGKHCSMWVSAFETLAHTGNWTGIKQVLDLIEKRPLKVPRLQRGVLMNTKRKGTPRVMNVAQRLYVRLYQARNDFLHGNKIGIQTFIPSCLTEGVRLLDVAPLVYVAALEGALVRKARQTKKLSKKEKMAAHIREILSYKELEEGFQRAIR